MRRGPIVLSLLLCAVTPAFAQLSINFGSPGVSLGINLGGYPTLQRIPGYPVYYAPGLNSNYFFYDGLYWVYEADSWYESSWYNGPWRAVDPFDVPVYLLRVPVRYYRHAPAYFHGWRADQAPRWGEHWGRSWEQRRSGWDHWDRRSAPAPAPLPTYQRQYRGDRYPQATQQADLQNRNYRYQPHEEVARQHYDYQRGQARSAPQQRAPQQQHNQPQPQQQHNQPQPQQQHNQPQPQQQRDQRRDQPQQRDQSRTPQTDKEMERKGGTGQDQRG
jgi:hypothetical protein